MVCWLRGQNVAPLCSGPKDVYSLYQLTGSIASGNEAWGIRSSPCRLAAAFFACLQSEAKRKLPCIPPDPSFSPGGLSLASP